MIARWRGAIVVGLIPNDERIEVLFRELFVGRFIRGNKCDRTTVGPPRKLLDPFRRLGYCNRIAPAKIEDPYLLVCVVAATVVGEKRELGAVRRPRRRCQTFAFEGERACRLRRDVVQLERPVVGIRLEVLARQDERNLLAVGRNRNVRNAGDLGNVVKRKGARRGRRVAPMQAASNTEVMNLFMIVVPLLQVLLEPVEPVFLHVFSANRIGGKVSRHRIGDELHRRAVVLERVVELE